MRSVIIRDYTNYVEDKATNGGCYVDFTYFDEVDADLWRVSYSTSAEFSYCPAMGHFDDCCDDCIDCDCFEFVSTDDVYERIAEYGESDNVDIEYIGF